MKLLLNCKLVSRVKLCLVFQRIIKDCPKPRAADVVSPEVIGAVSEILEISKFTCAVE